MLLFVIVLVLVEGSGYFFLWNVIFFVFLCEEDCGWFFDYVFGFLVKYFYCVFVLVCYEVVEIYGYDGVVDCVLYDCFKEVFLGGNCFGIDCDFYEDILNFVQYVMLWIILFVQLYMCIWNVVEIQGWFIVLKYVMILLKLNGFEKNFVVGGKFVFIGCIWFDVMIILVLGKCLKILWVRLRFVSLFGNWMFVKSRWIVCLFMILIVCFVELVFRILKFVLCSVLINVKWISILFLIIRILCMIFFC